MLNCRSKNKVKISNLSGDILFKKSGIAVGKNSRARLLISLKSLNSIAFFMYAYWYAKSHPHSSVQSVLIADLILRTIFGKL